MIAKPIIGGYNVTGTPEEIAAIVLEQSIRMITITTAPGVFGTLVPLGSLTKQTTTKRNKQPD